MGGGASTLDYEREVSLEEAKEHAGDKWTDETEMKYHEHRGERPALSVRELSVHFPEFFSSLSAPVETTEEAPAPADEASPPGVHLYVAVDGSVPAHSAFQLGAALRGVEPASARSVLEVVHVVGQKEYLAPEMKSEAIKERYEVDLLTHVSTEGNRKYTGLDRNGGSTKDTLMKYINDEGNKDVDPASGRNLQPIMLCGITGRKSVEGKPTIFGQTSGLAMRICQHPVIVYKGTAPDFTTRNKFMFAVDLSDRVMHGYRSIKHIIRPDIDQVVFLHVYAEEEAGENNLAALQTKLEEFISTESIPNASVVCIPRPRQNRVADALCIWARDNDVDFTVVTIRYREKYGSTGEGVGGSAVLKTSTIFIKEEAIIENM